jgi:hypothetical protein
MTDIYGHGESIYNIVPPKEIEQQKLPMYRSQHNPLLPPTNTSFGGAQTSHPVCMNIAGDTRGRIVPTKAGRTFGQPKGSYSSLPNNYMKKNSSTSKIQTLSEVRRSAPNLLQPSSLKAKLKPDVPKTSDAPVMNLVTSKNFVVANAVETILAAPKKVTTQAKDYLNKDDYGKVPKYLKNIKNDIEAEYDYIRMLQEQEEEEAASQHRTMPEEERIAILNGLKAKWEAVNTEFQGAAHLTVLDSSGKIYRKEKWESQLAQI